MISAIVNGLFNLITELAALITTPLIAGLTALIPGLRYFNFIYKIIF